MRISIKRVYENPHPTDGLRILVDRLWPRGVSKKDAKIDIWLKAGAPSNELRKWYSHDPLKWVEFKRRYFRELDSEHVAVRELVEHVRKGKVTFLFSSKELRRNNAVALQEYLRTIMNSRHE